MHRFQGIQIWAVLAGLMLASWLVLIVAPDEFLSWSREDGLVEWLGTLLFAAAAVLFIVAAVRRLRGSPTHGRGRTIGMLLFLGLVFSVAFMEEVSWGQRVIGWETPGALSASVQDESNLHNLPAQEIWMARSTFSTRRSVFMPGAPSLMCVRQRRCGRRVWLAQGRLTEALAWVRERDLSVDDELSYLRESEHITLASVLIARFRSNGEEHSIHEALGLLARLLTAAEDGGRTGSAIEILALQALALEAAGDIPGALAPLERALSLAEPEGYLRIFVGQGEPMRTLLRHAAAAGLSGSYTQRLLSAFDQGAQPAPVTAPAPQAELPEPLTAREVDILRLVAAGMRNQEIADQLVISVATVKRHIANVYGKLGVGHRTEAVARANELNLL